MLYYALLLLLSLLIDECSGSRFSSNKYIIRLNSLCRTHSIFDSSTNTAVAVGTEQFNAIAHDFVFLSSCIIAHFLSRLHSNRSVGAQNRLKYNGYTVWDSNTICRIPTNAPAGQMRIWTMGPSTQMSETPITYWRVTLSRIYIDQILDSNYF